LPAFALFESPPDLFSSISSGAGIGTGIQSANVSKSIESISVSSGFLEYRGTIGAAVGVGVFEGQTSSTLSSIVVSNVSLTLNLASGGGIGIGFTPLLANLTFLETCFVVIDSIFVSQNCRAPGVETDRGTTDAGTRPDSDNHMSHR
jgi:hypothetical protein